MSVTVPGVRNHAIEIQVATDVYSKKRVFSQHLLNNTTFINVPIQYLLRFGKVRGKYALKQPSSGGTVRRTDLSKLKHETNRHQMM